MKDLALHFAGGLVIYGLEYHITGSAVLGVWWAVLIGFVRESEQARRRDRFDVRQRPSYFWRWSGHRLAEWAAWPVGALAALVAF